MVDLLTNINDIKNELKYHAAMIYFKPINTTEIKNIFDELMNQSIFFDEFIDIIYPKSDYTEEFILAFNVALKRLGITVPNNRDEAVLILLKYYITKIALSEMDPIEILEKIMRTIDFNTDIHFESNEYLGDYYGVHSLLGLYYEYGDILDNWSLKDKTIESRLIKLKKELMNLAARWVKQYS